MRKILISDILPLIYNYLRQQGLKSFAEKLNKMSGLDLEDSESPLASKKLAKIIKFYIKNNEKMLEQFQEHPETESEEEEEEVESEQEKKSKKQKKSKKNKKQESEEEEEESEEEEQQTKKQKSKKRKVSSESEEESSEQIVKKVKKENKNESLGDISVEEEPQGTGAKFFQRCDDSRMNDLQESLKDNTFEAKFKFGNGGDETGRAGWEILKDKRGKDFKKEKGKLKAKAFWGKGEINPNALNGIKL